MMSTANPQESPESHVTRQRQTLSLKYFHFCGLSVAGNAMTLPTKTVSLAECLNSREENGNDKDDENAVNARIQAGSGVCFGLE